MLVIKQDLGAIAFSSLINRRPKGQVSTTDNIQGDFFISCALCRLTTKIFSSDVDQAFRYFLQRVVQQKGSQLVN